MLQKGSQAPLFSLPDQNNELINLKNFRGRWVILYFYPKDMTPGCTTEACNFMEIFPKFENLNAVVLGISKDTVEKHKKFAQKYDLKFPLLSDQKSDVCETFGVWQKKSLYGREFMGIVRSTYLINPEGIIEKVYPKVKVNTHHLEILADLNSIKNDL
ncbi:MAG: thioredoxin-dependent thiol peroxidase [Calditrichaceae bacterium]|nr:thioredoxin-dependent thiol peroxidase [Calditrichaceae bacterium]MBN2710470.1 thioredoxin-dependent thiol peroxidase [Calditrichaceae bacterium]